jgi:RHS repeat-associated protein
VISFAIVAASGSNAQVSTGTPAFSSFGGGPFDTVNLGNLNVHFAIPILSKVGRGTAFSYALTYDSSIWVPTTSSGITQWQPTLGWGWNTSTAAFSGYVSASNTTTLSNSPCTNSSVQNVTNYVYHDQLGKVHPFAGSTYYDYYPCLHPPVKASGSITVQSTDGSGLTLVANLTTWSITFPSGRVITGPINQLSSTASYTDANGNQLTVNSSGQYFDTLSSTSPVLTTAGSGTPASPNTFKYIAPSGATATYSMNYTQYTVKTAFGVSNSAGAIAEYGPTSVALPSSIQLPDGTTYAFLYEQTPGSCTPLAGTYSGYCVTGRLNSVTLPTGGSITYSYNGGPGSTGIYSDGSTSGLGRALSPNTCGAGGCWQYSRALQGSTAPGPGSKWITTVTDPQNNSTVINFAEDGITGTPTYNLYPTQKQVYQGSALPANLLETKLFCYNGVYTSCSTAAVTSPISTMDSYKQLPNGLTRQSHFAYNGSYTGSGLISDDKEYDFGVTLGAAPGTAHLLKETATTYASLGNGIINKPSNVTITAGSSTLSNVSYSYDQTAVTATSSTPQHTAVSGSRGNVTTVSTATNSGTNLYRTYSYFDTGTVNTATDVSTSTSSPGAATTYSYSSGSCGNSFPTGVTEPLSLTRSITWNCSGAVMTSGTDENGQTSSVGYTADPYFWRPNNSYDQENNETTMTYSGQTSSESKLSFNGGNSVSDTLTTLDGFGRTILSQQLQAPSSSNYDSVETDYDSDGRPYQSSMPFSASAGSTNPSALHTVTQYDALKRPLSITDAGTGVKSFTYSNNDVLVTTGGPGSTQVFKRNKEYDGLGHLTSVCEVSSTLPGVGSCGQSAAYTGYLTKYSYDGLGRLLSVTQNAQATGSAQQTRSYSYDYLGRMTSEANPENGTVAYTYDLAGSCAAHAGSLTQKVNNTGNTTCYYYDALNRMTKEGSSGPVCRWFNYDTSVTPPSGVSVSNTKTRMEEAYTDNCAGSVITNEWFSYSPRGELTDVYESTPHSGGYYHTAVAYWPSGALETLSGIPSVPTLNYGASGPGLDGEGRYTQVSASSPPNPVTSVSYSTSSTVNTLGSLIGITYGSGDSDAFAYDPNTGRHASYKFTVGTSTDQGTLTWSPNKTLSSLVIVDAIAGTSDSQNCGFTYDDLGRVGGQDSNGYSVDCGTKWQQKFTYDAFGNVSKSGDGSFAPTYSNATNQFTLGGLATFDGNGNMTSDANNNYTWDPNWGTLASINSNATTYDALGRVVEQQGGSSYAEVVYSPLGKTAIMNGPTLVKAFVSLPGGGTAVYGPSGLSYYRHPDWLGSSRLASTQSRTLYSSMSYAPFGEPYSTSGTADQSFTGQNSDTVNSLYDFLDRRLSPSMGRWISPDPSGIASAHIGNPQSWNRYAYVGNRPLNHVDALGLDIGADICDDPSACLGDESEGGGGGEGDTTDPGTDPGTEQGDGSCSGALTLCVTETVTTDPDSPINTDVTVNSTIPDEGNPDYSAPDMSDIYGQPTLNSDALTLDPLSSLLRNKNYFQVTCYGNPAGLSLSKRGCNYACGGEEEWGPFNDFPTAGVMFFTQKQLAPVCGSSSEIFCPRELQVQGNVDPILGIAPNPYIVSCKQ